MVNFKYRIIMATSQFGRHLNPYRQLGQSLAVKGTRQSVVITNNPSNIDQNQMLTVRFPNLGPNDVIVPGSVFLFTMTLNSTDANRTIVQNIGRAIVKKLAIKISGNAVLSIDDADIYCSYSDLWKTTNERLNSAYQDTDVSTNRNQTRLRIGAGNATQTAGDIPINTAFGNRFRIPLDFELLESHMPFYQSALGDRLQ